MICLTCLLIPNNICLLNELMSCTVDRRFLLHKNKGRDWIIDIVLMGYALNSAWTTFLYYFMTVVVIQLFTDIYHHLYLLSVSRCPLSSEDLPGAFYLGEAGSGRQGSPGSTKAERHGWGHFTKGSLPFHWAGFIKTASFWQFNWKILCRVFFPSNCSDPFRADIARGDKEEKQPFRGLQMTGR